MFCGIGFVEKREWIGNDMLRLKVEGGHVTKTRTPAKTYFVVSRKVQHRQMGDLIETVF